jgi:hypothetical protein
LLVPVGLLQVGQDGEEGEDGEVDGSDGQQGLTGRTVGAHLLVQSCCAAPTRSLRLYKHSSSVRIHTHGLGG